MLMNEWDTGQKDKKLDIFIVSYFYPLNNSVLVHYPPSELRVQFEV